MSDRPIIFSAPFNRRLALSGIDGFMWFVAPEPNTGCWIWLGPVNAKGYGRLHGSEAAHRVALALVGRPPQRGMDVHHVCRVRCCVNPDHLVEMTHRENLLNSDSPAGVAARKVACVRGHSFSGGDTTVRGGKRFCRECDRLRQIAAYIPTTSRRRRRHLRAKERAEIIALIRAGVSHSKIALHLNVSVATVSNVRRGKNRYDRPANNL